MIKVRASAKVNLYLDVIGKRPDGFHEIETIYQPISIADELQFELTGGEISLQGSDPEIPWDDRNLIHRAARLFLDRSGKKLGIRVRCFKNIPSKAGLGGGSADAAATLVALSHLLGFRLSSSDLAAIGLRLGSDVPFFIYGKPAIGRGRGEILEPVKGLGEGWIVVVKPNVSISTEWAYRNLNLILTKSSDKVRLTTVLDGLRLFPYKNLATHNSFEPIVSKHFPEVARALELLREAKPILSSLSGSGSACFAVFDRESKASEVARDFEREGYFARIARPVPEAIRIEE